MKKWITTSNISNFSNQKSDPYYNHNSCSPFVYADMDKSRPPAKLPDEDELYDNLENYRASPPTSNDSQTGYVASSSSVLSGEDSFYDNPYSEIGMFSGPVTDLDEDSDPDEIKTYNPSTKTISIRKPRGRHNVEVQINVQLKSLEQDIQRMIDEMASLEGSVRSDTSPCDSGIHESQDDVDRIEEDTGEHRTVSTKSRMYGSKNRKLYYNESNKWNIERPNGERDVKTITCLVNENFDESRVFKSSVTGVPLGMTEIALGPPKQAPDWRSGVPRNHKRQPVWNHKRQPVQVSKQQGGNRAICSVGALGLAVALVSMTYHAAANMQSTLRTELNIGMVTLMTEQAAKMVCAMFIPIVVSKWPGRKWGCCIGALLACAWPAVQLLPPSLPQLFGAAAVVAATQGLSDALLLGAALPLVCEIADSRGPEAIAAALCTITAAWALGQAAAGMLDVGVLMGENMWQSLAYSDDCFLSHCLAPAVSNASELQHALEPMWLPLIVPPVTAALIIAVAVRPPSKAEKVLDDRGRRSHLNQLRRFVDCRLLLLIPSAAFSGLLDAFITAELPKELSACAWGGARGAFGPAVASLAHAFVAAILIPAVSRATTRLPSAAVCSLLAAAAGGLVSTDWISERPERYMLPVCLAGGGAAFDLVTVAAAAYAFPERRTMAFSFLLGARSGGCLLMLAMSRILCVDAKLLLLAGVLLIALTATAALERLWGVGTPPPLPSAATDTRGERPRRGSPDDGMVDVPLDRVTNY